MRELEERFKALIEEDEKDPEYWMEQARIQVLAEIENAMKAKGVKQKDLAKRLGFSQAYASKLFHCDVNNFTLKTIVQLGMAVGLKPSIHFEKLDLVSRTPIDTWVKTRHQAPEWTIPIQPIWLEETRKSIQAEKTSTTQSCASEQQEETNEATRTSDMRNANPIAA